MSAWSLIEGVMQFLILSIGGSGGELINLKVNLVFEFNFYLLFEWRTN